MSSTARTEGRPSALSASSITPIRADFRELARHGNLIPVRREILADLETPVSAFLKIHRGPYGFLLESVEGGEKWGRYSFLGTEPARIFRARGEAVEGGLDRLHREVEHELTFCCATVLARVLRSVPAPPGVVTSTRSAASRR